MEFGIEELEEVSPKHPVMCDNMRLLILPW
jgi:hypothetical protein